MKIKKIAEGECVSDILCDVCLRSTRVDGCGHQYGMLQANWGWGSAHDGERYEIHLCEGCFFQAVAGARQERRIHTMFSEPDSDAISESFGRVAGDGAGEGGGNVTGETRK